MNANKLKIKLPDHDQPAQIPSASIKPIMNTQSRLPKLRPPGSGINRLPTSDSELPSGSSNGVTFADPVDLHTEASEGDLAISRPVSKRTQDSSSCQNANQSKRFKPENVRVASLKQTKQKAARRSLSNAIKISRNRAAKDLGNSQGATKVSTAKRFVTKPIVQSSRFPKPPPCNQGSTNFSANVKPRVAAAKPRVVNRAAPTSVGEKKTNGNTSNNSVGGMKRPKRKPWDLKGQVEDLKEQLVESKQKESTIDSILQRLEALEAEKTSIVAERSALSTDVVGLKTELDRTGEELQQKRTMITNFEIERQDLKRQLATTRKMCDEYELDLRQERREKMELLEKLEKLEKLTREQEDTLRSQNEEIEEKNMKIVHMKKETERIEEDRRKLLNVVQELKGNIRVFCRVRPMLPKEASKYGEISHIEFHGNDEKSLVILNDNDKPTTYNFDKVFNITTTQAQVFDEVYQLIESVLDGYNVCVFAYGQTGAGKTYTMEGKDHDGIIPRSMRFLFSKAEEKKKFGWEFKFSVQHTEIYQETLQDLLKQGDDKLEIKTVTNSGKQKIWVKNLSSHQVASFEQVRNLLELSKKKRVTAATAANERSSRSHSVFMLKVEGRNNNTGELVEAALNLIDLAGSERTSETGCSGTRLKEAKTINSSLTQLSNVIAALANKESHVPYRNSKLTFLLMDSLGGNSKTLMMVNINPTRPATNESINTLRFATTVNKCNIGTAQKVVKFQ